MELKQFTLIIRKWARHILVGLIVGCVIGYLASLIEKPIYEATTNILVTRNPQGVNLDYAYLSDQQLVQTYLELLLTQPVIDAASGQMNFKINSQKITVKQKLNTQIIQVTVQDGDSQRAMQIANTLVKVLMDKSENLQANKYASTENGLNLQIQQEGKQLNDLQTEYAQLTEKDLQDQLDQVGKQVASLQAEITTLRSDVVTLDPPTTINQRIELSQKQARLSQIEPLLLYYQQALSNLKLIGKPSTTEGTMRDPRLADLQSKITLYEQLHTDLSKEQQSMRLMRLQYTPNITQLEQATSPSTPIRPIPLLYTLFAGVVGFLLVGGAVFIIEYMDDSLKLPSDLQNVGLPIIGLIPDVKQEVNEILEVSQPNSPASNVIRMLRVVGLVPQVKQELNEILAISQPDSLASNAIRMLRANLSLTDSEKPLKTILIVSPGKQDGKTTVAINLAVSFALLQKRVIIIDGNARAPRLHKIVGVENSLGLSDVLARNNELPKALHVFDGVSNLKVLPSGEAVSNLTEMLVSDQFPKILKLLSADNDIIIIDGSAASDAEALAIASQMDGAVLVVRPEHTNAKATLYTVDEFRRLGVKLSGLVVNRAPESWNNFIR